MNQRDQQLLWLHEEKTLVAGVDIAKQIHWMRVVDSIGLEVGKPLKFENSRDGFSRLVETFERAMSTTGATRMVVAMEPSGHYWKPLAHHLEAAQIKVVLVNPFHVKRTKEIDDNSPTKNDRKDARTIADMARQGKFMRCMLPKGAYADLRVLNQARQDQVRKLNAAVNRLHTIMDEYYPEFPGLFSKLLGKTPLLVLELCPFPGDVLLYSEIELAAKLKAHGLRARKKTLHRLRETAARSIGVKAGLESARLFLRTLLEEIHFWLDRLDETEAAVAKALSATGVGDYLLSIPGVGVLTAAGFLGEVGDLAQYQDSRQLIKMAGLNLTENSSGKHVGKTRISKRGRPYLRCLLYQAVLCMVAHNREFKALFQLFKTRKQNPLKGKQALIALACKLIRVIFGLVTKGKMYDPAKVLGSVRADQIVSAA